MEHLKALSKELNELLDMVDNNSCYVVTIYKVLDEDYIPIDSKKFNSFKDASEYRDKKEAEDKYINITRVNSLDEVLETQKKEVFNLTLTEDGYYLTNDTDRYQIYPYDKQKENITEAINDFIEDEYIYTIDKEIHSSALKWVDFDPIECSGIIEIILFF